MEPRPQPTQHFFTAALEEGQPGSLIDHIETLQLAWRACKDRYPFTLTAGVILPDHLHAIVAVPPGDRHGAARWGLLQELIQHVANRRSSGLSLEHRPLRDEADVERHIDYVHADPLRHGWVRSLRKWPYSSLHAYIAHGRRPLHWTGGLEGSYGARVGSSGGAPAESHARCE